MPRLTNDEIKQIEERSDRSTPGPWNYDSGNWEVECRNDLFFRHGICSFTPDIRTDVNGDFTGLSYNTFDAEFIANARQDIPRLLSEVKALRKVYDTAKKYKSFHISELREAIEEYEANDKTT